MPVILGRKLRHEDSEFRPELYSNTLPQKIKENGGGDPSTAFGVTYCFICGHWICSQFWHSDSFCDTQIQMASICQHFKFQHRF